MKKAVSMPSVRKDNVLRGISVVSTILFFSFFVYLRPIQGSVLGLDQYTSQNQSVMLDHISFGNGHCTPHALKNLFEGMRQDQSLVPSQFQLLVQYFFDQCQGEFSSYVSQDPTEILNLLAVRDMRINLAQHPSLSEYSFRLENGNSVTGILGLKPDQKLRPLVLFRCGNMCDPTDALAMGAIASFFDASPFHVFVVNNLLSSQEMNLNGRVSLGGLSGGIELLEIAEHFRNQEGIPIHSVHTVGYSLGGHDALYSALYDLKDHVQPIQSASAICPVVDIDRMMNQYVGNWESSWVQDRVWKGIFSATQKRLDPTMGISRLLKSILDEQGIPPAVAWLEEMAAKEFYDSYFLPERDDFNFWEESVRDLVANQPWLAGRNLGELKNFRQMHDFKNFSDQIHIPTFAWFAENDSVLSYDIHGDGLKGNSSLAKLVTPFGDHCGFFAHYGWALQNTVLQEFIMNNSPGFSVDTQKFRLNFSKFTTTVGIIGEIHWDFHVGKTFATVSLVKNSTSGHVIDQVTPLVDWSFNIDIGLRKAPENESQTAILERWANTNIIIEDENGTPLLGNHFNSSKSYVLRVPSWKPF
ncbi:MAG: hypothetical protein AAF203_03025 [Pseudomonadota bacterium]